MGRTPKLILIAVALALSCTAGAADAPPPPSPWVLPTFDPANDAGPTPGQQLPRPSRPTGAPAKRAPFEPGRAIALVADCWPSPSWFRPEIGLEIRSGQKFGRVGENDQTQANYVGIVARMPLYSASELDKEYEREAGRMQQAAQAVGQIVEGLAAAHRARRETELYEALERRAQVRVSEGVAITAEQVSALKEVATAHTGAAQAAAKLVAYRLHLQSLCRRDRAAPLFEYLDATLGPLR
jgi:hypothetical protein